MESKNIKSTQIRLPTILASYIESEAERTGISQNSIMLLLMDEGKRLREACVEITIQSENHPHTDSRK